MIQKKNFLMKEPEFKSVGIVSHDNLKEHQFN